MGTNYNTFTKELDRIQERIEEEIMSVLKDSVSLIFEGVREIPPVGTPVDTGWARAGWRVSVNKPTPGFVPDKGKVSAEESQALASIRHFLSRTKLKNISSIFIDNRVSYIEDLNNGSSMQSPLDFIDLAVQRGLALIRRRRRIR